MILSVSRRTDIPAFYAPWFMNRLREGYVLVRNPMNYHQVSRVSLAREVIDCIVFWTKNPEPLLPYLPEIREHYPFYFQYTLNAYGPDLEPGLPPLKRKLDTFRRLAELVGPERIVWRYDPVLLSARYPADWHIQTFEELAATLAGHAVKGVFSFVDLYPKIQKNLRALSAEAPGEEEMQTLAEAFARTAEKHRLPLETCAEGIDLSRAGIPHGHCIDGDLIAALTGWQLKAKKDPNQRSECGCLESIDIGQYNTCRHGCKYCYATFNPASVAQLSGRHDPESPFLVGRSEEGDKVTERKMKTLKDHPTGQIDMFG